VSAAGASEAPPATRLQLEVVAGNAAGTVIGVGEQLVFGRQTEGYGQLANDPELSRHHAEVARLPTGEYRLEDLSSTNGTFVNGARLQAPVVLALGDEIELGSSKLVVRALPAVAAPPAGTVDVRAATVVVDVPAAARAPTPPAAPVAESEPPPPAPPPAPPPPLELRLRVDLEREEAEIALDQGPSVRLRLKDGSWRIAGDDLP
jgi:predicted component of type VI protein secretion system